MMRLLKNEQGATTVELAFIMPVFLVMIFGIVQLGMVFMGQSGMSHALGEGARMATLYPTPTNAAIKTNMEQSVFKANNFGTYTVDEPVRTGLYMTLKVRYNMPMTFVFFRGPNIVMIKEKVVYTASKVS